MKVRCGDKVVLFSVKNVYGADYQCYYGTLLSIRNLYDKKVYKIKAERLDLIDGHLDMKGKELEVYSGVFTLKLWSPEAKLQLKELKTACVVLNTTLAKLASLGAKTTPKMA